MKFNLLKMIENLKEQMLYLIELMEEIKNIKITCFEGRQVEKEVVLSKI
jgi:hypothetical protein